ncbi:MAG: tetratricopeptide repeat protein [Tepidisphaeraceae bacterium]
MTTRYAKKLPVFVVALATLGVFAPLCRHEFLTWDDPFNIAANPNFNPPTWRGIANHWQATSAGLYVPLTYSVWGGLAFLSSAGHGAGPNPWLFHGASVALHVLCATVVFATIKRLFGTPWAAAAGALFFAVHPLQVEAVAWASGLKDVLAGVLSLLAVWQYVRFAQGSDNASRVIYCGATAALLLAMLAKPNAVVAIGVALVLDLVFLRRNFRQVAGAIVPWIILCAPLVAVARIVQSGQPLVNVPIFQRPLVALDALGFYLWKLILPINLAPVYGRTPASVISQGWTTWTWMLPVALALLLTIARCRRHLAPPLAAGALIFIVSLLPVLGFTPFIFQFFSSVADHYLYIAMLGPAIVFAYLCTLRRTLRVACAAVLVVLAVMSVRQQRHWTDSIALFEHTLRVAPDAPGIHNNYGAALADVGRLDEALARFQIALTTDPDNRLVHTNLAQLYALFNDPDRAIAHVEIALRQVDARPRELGWDPVLNHYLLGVALMTRQRFDDAAVHFEKVLMTHPQYKDARGLLGYCRTRASTRPAAK